jgi:hypothetical protein
MVCPVLGRGCWPVYEKKQGQVQGIIGIRYDDGRVDGLRIMKKPFLCSDGIERQVVWVRRLGRVFVEWNGDRAILRAAESGADGSIYTPDSARKYVRQ